METSFPWNSKDFRKFKKIFQKDISNDAGKMDLKTPNILRDSTVTYFKRNVLEDSRKFLKILKIPEDSKHFDYQKTFREIHFSFLDCFIKFRFL